MYIGIQVLRGKIRGLQAAGETIHHRIKKCSGLFRNNLWNEKRCLGSYNRAHLVAYGILRGVPYDRIERCAPLNKPNPQMIFELVQLHGDWKQRRELTLEKVKSLLAPTLPTENPETRQL